MHFYLYPFLFDDLLSNQVLQMAINNRLIPTSFFHSRLTPFYKHFDCRVQNNSFEE